MTDEQIERLLSALEGIEGALEVISEDVGSITGVLQGLENTIDACTRTSYGSKQTALAIINDAEI